MYTFNDLNIEHWKIARDNIIYIEHYFRKNISLLRIPLDLSHHHIGFERRSEFGRDFYTIKNARAETSAQYHNYHTIGNPVATPYFHEAEHNIKFDVHKAAYSVYGAHNEELQYAGDTDITIIDLSLGAQLEIIKLLADVVGV